MGITLSISPHGRLFVEHAVDNAALDDVLSKRLEQAFAQDPAQGILHLATRQLQANLPLDFAFARDFGARYLTRLCHTPEIAATTELPPVPVPSAEKLAAIARLLPRAASLKLQSRQRQQSSKQCRSLGLASPHFPASTN